MKRLQAGHAAEEISGLRRRIVDSPVDFTACYLISLASGSLGNHQAERVWIERSLILVPEHAHVHTSHGIAQLRDQDIEGAHAAFDRAIKFNRNFSAARYNRALIELEAMHFSRGWADYEWRFSYPAAPGVWREFPSPTWDGVSPLEGKLLVWAEQSTSSQIMFASVLRELDLPNGLIVEAEAGLVPLLRRSLPEAEVVAVANPPNPRLFGDDIAAQIPMGRLCGLRRRSLRDFQKNKPGFLTADAERTIDFMLDLAKPEQRTIGLAWRQSSTAQGLMSLAKLEPALRAPNVTWVSLEGNYAEAEIRNFKEATGIQIESGHDLVDSNDLDGLAALIAACDLVLPVDNTVAHLAGSLGRAVWTLLPDRHAARWYWFSQHQARPRKISRWYPSMRLIWKMDNESDNKYVARIGDLITRAIAAK